MLDDIWTFWVLKSFVSGKETFNSHESGSTAAISLELGSPGSFCIEQTIESLKHPFEFPIRMHVVASNGQFSHSCPIRNTSYSVSKVFLTHLNVNVAISSVALTLRSYKGLHLSSWLKRSGVRLPLAGFSPNEQREDAPHFTFMRLQNVKSRSCLFIMVVGPSSYDLGHESTLSKKFSSKINDDNHALFTLRRVQSAEINGFVSEQAIHLNFSAWYPLTLTIPLIFTATGSSSIAILSLLIRSFWGANSAQMKSLGTDFRNRISAIWHVMTQLNWTTLDCKWLPRTDYRIGKNRLSLIGLCHDPIWIKFLCAGCWIHFFETKDWGNKDAIWIYFYWFTKSFITAFQIKC